MSKWIQKAIPASHKGRLHKALHVPPGKTIPEKKLKKAEHSKNLKLSREANLANILKKLRSH